MRSSDKLPDYGQKNEVDTFVVPLWWNVIEAATAWDLMQQLKSPDKNVQDADSPQRRLRLPDCGLYALDGRHDGNPSVGMLYIGKGGTGEADDHEGFRSRLQRSLHETVIYKEEDDLGLDYDEFASNVWDVRVRFAAVEKKHAGEVEELLIKAHRPAINSQHVKGALSDARGHLLVLNAGAKGPLLPAVSSVYYQLAPWDLVE